MAGQPGAAVRACRWRVYLDLHGADRDRDFEAEFGEKNVTIRECNPVGPFQVPFEVFIPEKYGTDPSSRRKRTSPSPGSSRVRYGSSRSRC
jgi:hypothetical protein